MAKEMIPLAPKPGAVSRVGGSMKLTIPPLFFTLADLDKEEALEAETFYDGADRTLVVKIRTVDPGA